MPVTVDDTSNSAPSPSRKSFPLLSSWPANHCYRYRRCPCFSHSAPSFNAHYGPRQVLWYSMSCSIPSRWWFCSSVNTHLSLHRTGLNLDRFFHQLRYGVGIYGINVMAPGVLADIFGYNLTSHDNHCSEGNSWRQSLLVDEIRRRLYSFHRHRRMAHQRTLLVLLYLHMWLLVLLTILLLYNIAEVIILTFIVIILLS